MVGGKEEAVLHTAWSRSLLLSVVTTRSVLASCFAVTREHGSAVTFKSVDDNLVKV